MAKEYKGTIYYRRLAWIEKSESFDNEEELLKRQKELKKMEKKFHDIKEIRIVD